MEYRLVNRHGRVFVEVRYKGEEWNNWLFATSFEWHECWIYMPEFGLYRSNVSYG